ncbi:DUF4913 domain-containing protein [Kribbella sp. CA-253562]|uniref:DUF4913 domain-containing protein n=1 Tax=Kribbella sp. CA-253562 TaxID=3239942 RepID=UPI003D8D5B57
MPVPGLVHHLGGLLVRFGHRIARHTPSIVHKFRNFRTEVDARPRWSRDSRYARQQLGPAPRHGSATFHRRQRTRKPEFVAQFFARAYRREIAARRTWRKQWWKHPEVTARLDALWRSWEALRLEPGTGMSVWWRDHADHHMPRILDPDGPFKGCTTEGHQANGVLGPLPWDNPPEGLYAAAVAKTDPAAGRSDR